MNKQRRTGISKCITELEDIKSRLGSIYEEEDSARDAIPENLQNSDRYYDMEENCEQLNDSIEQIGDIIDILQEVVDR